MWSVDPSTAEGYAHGMKLWLKYLLGTVLGVLLSLALPKENPAVQETTKFLFDISMNIGRYALAPLILFSVPIAVYEQFENKGFWKDTGKTFLLLLLSGVFFSMIGVGIAAFMNPARIPLVAGAEAAAVPGLKEVLSAVFTDNMFAVLGSAGGYLLPLFVLALVLGLAFCHDRVVTKPAVTLFDSFSRIFYQINSFFAEFMGILLIAASTKAVSSILAGMDQTIYRPLLGTIGFELFLSSFIIIPAILWLFGGHKNPFPTLYGLAAPALASLVSGDVYFSMGVLQKHAKENLGIRRRSNALAIPFAILFGRVGTALVTSTSFIVILSSYSNLGISTSSFLWILAMTPLLTLIVGAAPRNGAMTALMVLCALYGRGFDNGYLIIVPVAFPLVAAGSFIDTLWAGCANLIIARKDGLCAEKEARFYI